MRQKLSQLVLGFVAICLTVYGFSGVSMGTAVTAVGGTSSFDTDSSASAETLEACSWYVSGIDPAVSLANSSGMEYVGNDYELSGENSDDILIHFSGNSTPETRCSFYDDVKGVSVNVSWDGTSFTNDDPSDTSLDFSAGEPLEDGASNEGDPSTFNITYTGTDCSVDWTTGATVKVDSLATPPLTPASIANNSVGLNYDPSSIAGATFASCALNATYSTWLPGNKTPNNPGGSYSFTGPTLTTQVVIND